MAIPNVVDTTPVERPTEPLSEAMNIANAQEEILKLMDADEAQPVVAEDQPVEETESQPEEEEEVLEEEAEVSESESEEYEDEDEEYEATDNRDAEGQETEMYTIKVDGQDIEVSLEELQQGYSRQSDYTKKTQELSEERRTIDAERAEYQNGLNQLMAQRQQYEQALGQLGQQLSQNMSKFQNVDWQRLKNEDPLEYVTKRDEFREEQERIKSVHYHQQQVQVQQQQEMEQIRQKAVAEEIGKLGKLIPEWNDPDAQPKIAKNIMDYGVTSGFTIEEMEGLVDSRSVYLIHKAMKYDALQNADLKNKKVKNKPKMTKSGAKRPKSDAKRRRKAELSKQLNSSGKVADAAKLLEDIF